MNKGLSDFIDTAMSSDSDLIQRGPIHGKNATHRVDLLNRHYEFEWPEDAAGHIRSFYLSGGSLCACSASVLDLDIDPDDGISAPEDETVVELDSNVESNEDFSIRSCKTNLMSFNPNQKAA